MACKIVILQLFFLITSFAFGQNNATSFSCIQLIENETIDGLEVLAIVDEMPQFTGGDSGLMKYISNNIKYPVLDDSDDLQFKVVVSFVVDTAGQIRNSCIMNPKFEDRISPIEAAVLEMIQSMPDWEPAICNGKKVPFRFVLPINIDWD